jgi:hypothetical protein
VAPTEAPPTQGATEAPPTPEVPIDCVIANITFDTLPNGTQLEPGQYVSDQWYDAYGLLLSATGGLGEEPRLFDSANPGSVTDLGAPNENCVDNPGPGTGEGGEPGNNPGVNCNPQGNVLIIQDSDYPDPKPPTNSDEGGTVTFKFTTVAQYVYEIGILATSPLSLTMETAWKRSSLALISWATTAGRQLPLIWRMWWSSN